MRGIEMRYKFCGGTTIKDNKTDGWAHDCASFADRLNEQQEEINKLRTALEFYNSCTNWDNEGRIKDSDIEYYGAYQYRVGGKKAREALK